MTGPARYRDFARRFLRAALVAGTLAAPACSLGPEAEADPASSIAITGVEVIPMTGAVRLQDATVIVTRGRIESIGPTGTVGVPSGATVVDGRGKYLIPGLWDMHVHITDATSLALPVLLANGITGVRDMGGDLALLRELERRRAAGEIPAPRIVAPGPYVDGLKDGLPFRVVVTAPGEACGAIDSLAALGVPFVKIHNGVPRDAFFALARCSSGAGLPLVGHVPLDVHPAEAVRAGQDGIEHFASLFEGVLRDRFAADPETMLRAFITGGELDTLMGVLGRNGTWFTPTVFTYQVRAMRGRLAARSDPRLRYVAGSLREQWDAWYPVLPRDSAPEIEAGRERFYELGLLVVDAASDAGVRLLAGTDLGARDMLPGFHLADELASLVAARLTPLEALRAATVNAAAALGRAEREGTVAVGAAADLVLLTADPLADIRNVRTVHAVIADGRLYDAARLASLLDSVAAVAPAR